MPRRTSKWKMSSFHLDAAHPDIVRIWKDQPIGTPFFTKLQRVLQFYRSFCKKRTAEGREDEKALMEELEATTSEVQVNVGDLVAQLAAVSSILTSSKRGALLDARSVAGSGGSSKGT
jgi:hypothetical protein